MILQKKYLHNFGIDVECFTINDKFDINKNSYLISNYALSEIDKE